MLEPKKLLWLYVTKLAGGESPSWHPLAKDFISLARKLEQLGFIYSKGEVLIIDELAKLGDRV